MAKKLCTVLVAALLFPLLLTPFASATQEAAWYLVDIVDYPNTERFATSSQHASYDYAGDYGRLAYGITQTFVGATNNSTTPPKVNGEALTIRVTSSAPPSVIKRDEKVELQLSIAAAENTQSFFSFSGGVKAYFDSADIGPGSATSRNNTLEAADGKSFFEVRKDNNYAASNVTVSATPRGGSAGSKMGLIISFAAGGVPMGTTYVYEWRTDAVEPPEPYEEPPQQPKPPEPKPPYPSVFNPEGGCPDVRFGDLTGEVNVKPADADDDAYVFAWLTMPLRHNDMIRTSPRSGAILSFADAATYVMGEESKIILDCAPIYENKLMYSFGQVWINFKSMVRDGSMDMQMAQAVAGIKGTTLILYCDGITSTVKVIEGEVEFRPNSGGVLTVTGGQMVSATDGKAGEVQPFNIDAELAKWDEKTQQMTKDILASLPAPEAPTPEPPQPSEPTVVDTAKPKSNNMMFVIPVALLAVLGVAFGFKKTRG